MALDGLERQSLLQVSASIKALKVAELSGPMSFAARDDFIVTAATKRI
jgi:hypothetical protein